MQNEEEVLRFFRDLGWTIVDTEQLSLAQQIRLFADAEIICAVHGGGLTNLLWCSPGCRVIELLADNFLNGVYEGISAMVRLSHCFLIFPGDRCFRARIDIPRLREVVVQCVRDTEAGKG